MARKRRHKKHNRSANSKPIPNSGTVTVDFEPITGTSGKSSQLPPARSSSGKSRRNGSDDSMTNYAAALLQPFD
jgi:hypothetical protein